MKDESASRAVDEGVIKFDITLETAVIGWPAGAQDLEAWRRILWQLELVGVERGAIECGYGNVSMRLSSDNAQPHFLITATQTGQKRSLQAGDYVMVTGCDLENNGVRARGEARPSSESLAHHMLYRLCPEARFVFHAHSALIWTQAAALGLPSTPAEVPYGTPAMAQAIAALFTGTELRTSRVLSMGGHKDGIIAFGPTADAAGTALIATLARALAMRAQPESPIDLP